MMRGRRRLTLVFALVVIGCGAVGIAYAAIPGANGVIQGCYDAGGNLKVVHSLPCPKGNTPVQWNQQGQQGLKGDKGDQGIAGAAATTYSNHHSHVVEGEGVYQEIAGLSDLPAGNYFFSISIENSAYTTSDSLNNQDLACAVNLNHMAEGSNIVFVEESRSVTWTFARSVGVGSDIIVECALYELGLLGDDATLAEASVTAMKIGALNP